MKTLKIVFNSGDEAKAALGKFAKDFLSLDIKTAPEVTEKIISFESVDQYEKVLLGRLNVLCKIKSEGPSSIYSLSKLLKKPYSSVLLDCQILESFGLITLSKDEENPRDASRPELAFDFDIIKVEGLYEINLQPKVAIAA